MTRAWWGAMLALAVAGCDPPTGPDGCPLGPSDDPAIGMPALDIVTALRVAGATVEDRGERFELTRMRRVARELIVNDHAVLWHEYCSASEARADARRFSADASTFDGVAISWGATPHVYLLAQVILIYEGDDPGLLELLADVMGAPVAEGGAGRSILMRTT